MQTQIFAHRGASDEAPENTLAAFKRAAEQGADGIELDVHLTKDGRVVVIHDDRVDRTADGTGAVSEKTFDELRRLDVSMGKAGFAGARIPTLEEVYTLVRDTRLQVNVEIKEFRMEKGGFAILPQVLELERQYGMSGRVVYSSFNHYLLRALKREVPGAQTAALYASGLVDVWEYARRVPVDAIHPPFLALQDPELMTHCHACGVKVRPWTVNRADDLKRMFAAKTDAVITNVPDLALRLRRQMESDVPASSL